MAKAISNLVKYPDGGIDHFLGGLATGAIQTRAGNQYTNIKQLLSELAGLYGFTSCYFTASRPLPDDHTSDKHRFGPSASDVRSWLSSSHVPNQDWALNASYIDVPLVNGSSTGYQKWTIPEDSIYRITCRGAHSGCTDEPLDYMRGVTVWGDFELKQSDYLLIAVGQGVPDMYGTTGDHDNGGAGGSWVALSDDGTNGSITTAKMLLVGNGAGGDTSDHVDSKIQCNASWARSVTNIGGVSGSETYPTTDTSTSLLRDAARQGYGGIAAPEGLSRACSGGYLSSGSNVRSYNLNVSGGGFRFKEPLNATTIAKGIAGYKDTHLGYLVGGAGISGSYTGYATYNTGNGGFGGGSGGWKEQGSAGGGFTGAIGTDDYEYTSHGTSFINASATNGGIKLNVPSPNGSYQSTDYTSTDQYQGWVRIEKMPALVNAYVPITSFTLTGYENYEDEDVTVSITMNGLTVTKTFSAGVTTAQVWNFSDNYGPYLNVAYNVTVTHATNQYVWFSRPGDTDEDGIDGDIIGAKMYKANTFLTGSSNQGHSEQYNETKTIIFTAAVSTMTFFTPY